MRIKVKEIAIILFDNSEAEDVTELAKQMMEEGYKITYQLEPVIAPYQNKIVLEKHISTKEDSRLYEIKPRYNNK